MNKCLVALTILGCFAATTTGQFVDTNGANIEDIAKLVCETTKGTKFLLGQFATIEHLVDYFSRLSSDHKLYGCRTDHLESLERLVEVIKTASDDVCGEQKLALIEDFHRKYVSKVSKHLKEHKRSTKAPKMIKLFFIQYATEVSSLCEQSAIKVLAENKQAIRAENGDKVEELRKFTDALGMTDIQKGFGKVYLFWNMVDSLDFASNKKFANYLDENGAIKLSVQMKDALRINALQAVCRHHMKPAYSKSILPVLRLVDMGYYPRSGQLIDEISYYPSTKSVFYITQICETLMPIAFYSDDKLDNDQFVAITMDEAKELSLPKLEKLDELVKSKPHIQAELVSFNVNDLILYTSEIDSIKSNVESRSKLINRMLKHLGWQLTSKLKSMFKTGVKLLRRDKNRKLKQIDVEKPSPLDQLNQLQVEEQEDGSLTRRKRDLLDLWLGFLFVVYMVVLWCVKIALFTVPMIIFGMFALGGSFDAKQAVKWMWQFGDPKNW